MIGLGGGSGWRHGICKPAPCHRRGAIQQVADRICQIVVDQISEALLLEITVLAEGNVAQQVPAHRIAATTLQQHIRIKHIAKGLAHLLAFAGQEAVAKYALWQRQPCGQQHRWPINRVEAQDVLANHM